MATKGPDCRRPISGGEEIVFTAATGGVSHPLTGKPLAARPLFGNAREAGPEDDPREVFADWMLDDGKILFSRVAVNRIWAELMGRGVVDPVDDLRATNPPSNPALLDALAEEFRRLKYDQKELLRLIVTSYVYGLSSLPTKQNTTDTHNFSRHYRQRLEAESLLDAIGDVTGVRESFSGMPPEARAVELWTHRIDSLFLDAFGRPDANQDPPCERTGETTVVQTLHLMNAPSVNHQLTSDDGRVARIAASSLSSEQIVEELYLATYSRLPTSEELAATAGLIVGGGRRSTPRDRRPALGTAEYTRIRFQKLDWPSARIANMNWLRNCEGLSRRDCLTLGVGCLAGGGFVDLLRLVGQANEAKPSRPAPRPASCILIWMDGGPSHFETFDPKPDAPAEIRGELGAISTKIPGVHFSEHLPRLAGIADKLAVVRSVCHNQGNHGAGNHYMMTGAPPRIPVGCGAFVSFHPSLGSVTAYERGNQGGLPAYFSMPSMSAIRRAELSGSEVCPLCRCGRPEQKGLSRPRRRPTRRTGRQPVSYSPRFARRRRSARENPGRCRWRSGSSARRVLRARLQPGDQPRCATGLRYRCRIGRRCANVMGAIRSANARCLPGAWSKPAFRS